VLLRLDVAERIAAELGYLTRRAPAPAPQDLASRLGVKADTLGVTLAALGFRLLEAPPLEEGQYGPPTPLRVAQPRPQHHQPRGADRRPGRAGQAAGPPQRDRRPPQHQRRPDAVPEASQYGPPAPSPQRDRRPPNRDRPEMVMPMEEGHYGPPAPMRLVAPEAPRHNRGPRPPGRPYQDKGPQQHGAPRHGAGGGPRHGTGDQRPDRPRGPRPEQGKEPRQPYQGRDRQETTRKPPEPRINPDSPFAILATLKLR
jgi:ATP-dependent RNA helicase SUPV3L1/SUV3